MTFSSDLLARAETVLESFRRRGWMLATAESCTGGLIGGCLTEIAGSSDVVERGFITYSNKAKTEMLGVAEDLIDRAGAVSGEVAESMANGALAHSSAQVAVSVTGIAGPGGGSAAKPVGLVYFGLAKRGGGLTHLRKVFEGDRAAIRARSVSQALDLLNDAAH